MCLGGEGPHQGVSTARRPCWVVDPPENGAAGALGTLFFLNLITIPGPAPCLSVSVFPGVVVALSRPALPLATILFSPSLRWLVSP